MSSINDGNLGNLDPNAAQVNAPINIQSTSESDTSNTSVYDSSISQSQLQAMVNLMVAGIPLLVPPNDNVESSSSVGQSYIDSILTRINLDTQQMEHDIIMKMWDTFIENLREIAAQQRAEQRREEIFDTDKTGPKSGSDYLVYLMSVSLNQRVQELDSEGVAPLVGQFSNTFNQWLVSPVDASSTNVSGDYPSSAFVAGAVAGSLGAIRSAIGADSATLGVQLSVSPVADSLLAVGPSSGLPGDYQAAAALVAAMMYNGALNRAVENSIDASASGGKPIQDIDFAVNFAKTIMAIVAKSLEGTQPQDPQQASQSDMMRLMLASVALNLLYRASYGGMSGIDMESLINGSATIPNSDPNKGIVDQLLGVIRGYLPADAAAREEAIARLSEYVDSKESADSMLGTASELSTSLGGGTITAARIVNSRAD